MRLNSAVRGEIMHQAMKDTFDKRLAALEHREDLLAVRAYNEAVPLAIRKAMDKMQALTPRIGWFKLRPDVAYNVAGQHIILTCHPRNVGDKWMMRCPTAYLGYGSTLATFTLDKHKKLVEDIRAWVNDMETYKTERSAAAKTLELMLKHSGSTESLFKAWPEGKKFYSTPPLTPVVKTGVPAVQVEQLNKALGLSL